jgi:hypothetical protein
MWTGPVNLDPSGIVKVIMDRKSQVLTLVLILIVVGVTVWKYNVFVVQRHYTIIDRISCDPEIETCFTYECAPGDDECDDTPFKKLTKRASTISLCRNYEEGNCPVPTCAEGEPGCSIISCSADTIEEDEVCTELPVQDALTASSSEQEL